MNNSLCSILSTSFTFIPEKKFEKHAFSLKNDLTTGYLDVISRNHSNRPSLNLSQNANEG